MIQTAKISWIGFCKRVSSEKTKNREVKVLEIPFKVEGERTKYLLRVTKEKKEKEIELMYELFQITQEYMGMFETLLIRSYKNETNDIIDAVLNHKRAKREYRWVRGWFH